MNNSRGDGTLIPFEIVPFRNGDNPTHTQVSEFKFLADLS